MNRLTTFFGASSLPDFKIQDAFVVSIANVRDGTVYLGIFNSWIQADTARRQAIEAKTAKRYKDAGAEYVRAGELLLRGQANSERYEAASCFEDAYKAFKAANDQNSSQRSIRRAAEIFEAAGSYSRSGRCFDVLGEQLKSGGDFLGARNAFSKAASSFGQADDGRRIHMLAQEADMLGCLGDYSLAISLYNEVILDCVKDSTLQLTIRPHLFSLLLLECGRTPRTGSPWSTLRRKYDGLLGQYPGGMNGSTPEGRLIESLLRAYDARDSTKGSVLLEEFLRSTGVGAVVLGQMDSKSGWRRKILEELLANARSWGDEELL
ncbi:soluble NSF attachment protein [Cladochytrium replicatum]|nr:soluble NSF attachment protein [Cladochytrium replicatum]